MFSSVVINFLVVNGYNTIMNLHQDTMTDKEVYMYATSIRFTSGLPWFLNLTNGH